MLHRNIGGFFFFLNEFWKIWETRNLFTLLFVRKDAGDR